MRYEASASLAQASLLRRSKPTKNIFPALLQMSKMVYQRLKEGLEEALAWSRGEIALPITDYSSGRPITTVRHRGAPAKIGDSDAPQKETPEER